MTDQKNGSCVFLPHPLALLPLLNQLVCIPFSFLTILCVLQHPITIIFIFSLQIAKLLQSMANRQVVRSHFKEEYMQPLQSFAMMHVDDVQVRIPCVLC